MKNYKFILSEMEKYENSKVKFHIQKGVKK